MDTAGAGSRLGTCCFRGGWGVIVCAQAAEALRSVRSLCVATFQGWKARGYFFFTTRLS